MLELAIAAAIMNPARTAGPMRETVFVENTLARLEVDPAGGTIVAFHFVADPMNPFTWDSKRETDAEDNNPRPRGHFLCLDRWGPATEAETARGMPKHGEASHGMWEASKPTPLTIRLDAILPIAGLRVTRTLSLHPEAAVVTVQDEVTNVGAIGRIYNLVQHPTIGPPFLRSDTIVDCNGTRGFFQGSPMPDPESIEVNWPEGVFADGSRTGLRVLAGGPVPSVMSYAVKDDIGWITATNAGDGLLLGYAWPAASAPWINLWQHVTADGPVARGLEFGTTGLHQPPDVLIRKQSIFDLPLVRFIDAGETQVHSFVMFLAAVPRDFLGVSTLSQGDGTLVLTETPEGDRKVLVPTATSLAFAEDG